MLVLAAVPDVQLHKLRRAAGLRFHLAHARTWDDALTTIRTRPVELAVVDPLLGGTPSGTEISRLRRLFPSLPLALYTTLSCPVAAVLLALGQSGIQNVVFARYDDHPARLREVLAAEEARSTSHRLREPAWTAAPSSAGSCGWGCARRATSWLPRACYTRTGCCRIPDSPSTTWRNGSAMPKPRRCSSTPATTSGSRWAKCATRSTRRKRCNAWRTASRRSSREIGRASCRERVSDTV